MVNGNGGIERRFSFTSKHSFNLVMNSGWFEYKVAKLLEGWSRAQEIWMNVVFPYKPGKDGTRKSKNEIDVIVHTGKKLLFVECKTSVFDKTDIDKFAAAVKNYGGMGSKALFITGAKLSFCKESGAAFVKDAALAIVVTADPLASDVWIEDASIASIMIQLQAEDLGLGSCWVQVRERFTANGTPANEYIHELLDFPLQLQVLSVIAIGHKGMERKPFDESHLQWEKVHINKFGGK
jgi:hypothetical protein